MHVMSLSGKLCISLAQALTLCTGCTIRAAVFDITGRKSTLCYIPKTARQESSNFYSDLRNASSSEITKYYCVNCRCSAVTMPIRSNSYATSSTSELVVSTQSCPCSSAMHAKVLSHVVFVTPQRVKCSCSIGTIIT